MANPQFTNAAEIPINEKPQCNFAQYKEIYLDTLDIFNTLRLILREFVEDAPADGKTYGRKDQSWVEVTGGGGGGGIPEAPVDGQLYGRKDAGWVIVPTIGSITWGSITGILSSQTDLSNALNGKEPTITAGTTSQYWRGDKTWQTLNWTAIASKPTFAAVATSGAYSDLSGKPTIPAAQVNSDWNATTGVAQILNKPSVRSILTAAVTYYVRTDGNDSNNGLTNTAGGAFATVQKAINVASAFDLNGYNITIKINDGTYTAPVTLQAFVGSGNIILEGNTSTPSAVKFTTSTTCVSATNCGNYTVRYIQLIATSGYGVFASGARTQLSLEGIVYGQLSSVGIHLYITARASVSQNTVPYSIIGGAYAHIYCSEGGSIEGSSASVTLTGTPAFTVFAYAENTALVRLVANSYTGAATGIRYLVINNAVLFTASAGASYLPGSSAGSTSDGGIYK